MPAHSPSVSVTDPISPALQRVKAILFSPFDLKKWFVIGFCAWLSSCGESGGGEGGGGGNNRGGSVSRDGLRRGLEQAWDYVVDNLVWILPLVMFGLLLCLVIWLLATWLNSHGKFMLLHCVAWNRAEIQVPWETYGRHAHSLFLFQICLGAISFLIIFPILLGCGAMLLQAFIRERDLTGPIILSVIGLLCVFGIGTLFVVIKKLLVDFVVPIMYLRTTSVRAAWGELRTLVAAHPGRIALYLLFSVVLTLILGTLILMVVLVTCCLACCLMLIPYIGTVLLLPVFVFKRAYSLCYLQQYGPEFSVIQWDEPLSTPFGAPPPL